VRGGEFHRWLPSTPLGLKALVLVCLLLMPSFLICVLLGLFWNVTVHFKGVLGFVATFRFKPCSVKKAWASSTAVSFFYLSNNSQAACCTARIA
jgi:hypothetical protein